MQNTSKPPSRYPSTFLENGTRSSYRPTQKIGERHQGAQRTQEGGQQAIVGEHRARETVGAAEEAGECRGGTGEEAGSGEGTICGAGGEAHPSN